MAVHLFWERVRARTAPDESGRPQTDGARPESLLWGRLLTDDGLPQFETREDHTVYWVQRAADDVRAAKSFYRKVEDTASRHSFLMAREMWRGATGRRRRTRRFLLHVFGYDPQIGRGFIRRYRDRWPRIGGRAEEWISLDRQYRRDSATVDCMLRAFRLAISEGRDPSMDMVTAWLSDQQQIVAECADQLAPWHDELTREAASVWVAGYVYAHLSLKYGRLRAALGPAPHRKLAALLPGAVVEAWAGGAARGEVASLPLEAARIIEGCAERKYRRRGLQPEYDPSEVFEDLEAAGFESDVLDWLCQKWTGGQPRTAVASDTLREDAADAVTMAAREDAARRIAVDDAELTAEADRLMAIHGLSERQAQVVYLVGEQGWTRQEAAARLGIDDATARQHWFRARRKILPAV
jgi:DNA-directed RNA polymerase specialized sigma24 family protein